MHSIAGRGGHAPGRSSCITLVPAMAGAEVFDGVVTQVSDGDTLWVRVQTQATDAYQRTLARVSVDGEDVGAWMTRQGHAWSDGLAHRPGPYADQQRQARVEGRGIFADRDAMQPGVFRRRFGARS